jgi:hypothetical protein
MNQGDSPDFAGPSWRWYQFVDHREDSLACQRIQLPGDGFPGSAAISGKPAIAKLVEALGRQVTPAVVTPEEYDQEAA